MDSTHDQNNETARADYEQDAAVNASLGAGAAAGAPPPSPNPQIPPLTRDDQRRLRKHSSLPYRSPALAGWLALMPGLGHVYLGYYQRGFINLAIIAVTITALASGTSGGLTVLFALFLAFYWMYNILDAVRRAQYYNQALDGIEGIELPEDFKMPDAGGGRFAGITLVVIGFILLLNTRFDISLEWLEEWWPLALIAGGGYLWYRSRSKS